MSVSLYLDQESINAESINTEPRILIKSVFAMAKLKLLFSFSESGANHVTLSLFPLLVAVAVLTHI